MYLLFFSYVLEWLKMPYSLRPWASEHMSYSKNNMWHNSVKNKLFGLIIFGS